MMYIRFYFNDELLFVWSSFSDNKKDALNYISYASEHDKYLRYKLRKANKMKIEK